MTVLLILVLAAPAVLVIRIIKSRKRTVTKLPLLLLCLLLMLLGAMLLYFSVYYHAGEEAKAALPETSVKLGNVKAWFFDGPGEDTALIFYPGAQVEAAAYAPLMSKLSAAGTDCFLVEMPLRFALLGAGAADRITAAYDYQDWIMAGHSLGGVAASLYTAKHPDSIAGLVMLASYPTQKLDNLPYLSIYGENDGVLNRESYEKSGALRPDGAREIVIPGGNHAGFADYGPQRGDGAAAITPAEQQKQTAEAIADWVHAHFTGRDEASFPAAEGLRVAVGSDLHLDPDNRANGAALSAAGYNLELVDALLWDARAQGAELILLTGDLVNGGKPHRHEALAEKLRRAEDAGLAVYVLPGNHDLAPIGQAAFAGYYADFGFDEACSRDKASLSYCVMRDDLTLLMMDLGGYGAGAIDLPGAGKRSDNEAFVSEATLSWAEEMLRAASKRGLPVLCAGHFNLLSTESRNPESTGYFVENGERLAALLRKYGVPLYLSGHTHVRAVYREQGLTEQVTEYLLSYPTGYTVLDITEDTLRCLPRRVDVDAWASLSGQTDKTLLHYADWQQEQLKKYSVENVEYMAKRNPISDREKKEASAFFYAVMNALYNGELFDQRGEMKAMPGAEPFYRCAEGYAYGWWLKDLLENVSPLLKGYTLEWK